MIVDTTADFQVEGRSFIHIADRLLYYKISMKKCKVNLIILLQFNFKVKFRFTNIKIPIQMKSRKIIGSIATLLLLNDFVSISIFILKVT